MAENIVLEMSRFEIRASAAFGNKIAREIIGKRQPQYKATLRHHLLTYGVGNAIGLAQRLLGVDFETARAHIRRLERRPDDVVVPWFVHQE